MEGETTKETLETTQTVDNRAVKVLKPNDAPPPSDDDINYELSSAELKRQFHDQQQKTEQNSVLSTKEWKERNKKVAQYDKVTIRFRFPDRLEIESVFNPDDTLDIMTQFLKDQVLSRPEIPFYLFLTPPLQRIIAGKSLKALGLIPKAIIHFAYEKGHTNVTEYIKPGLVEQAQEKTPSQPVVAQTENKTQEDKPATEKKRVPLPSWLQKKKK
ncbi:tether containing UBX domain for GLUT4 [Planoprotostelium fungivorum]|uniref:Tether containing UBX domain for GLUT4 n=1 Tax=Planoprotostelium fungivorum TaxID=1890364 RepID=A0A2P6NNM3_9EUKA|nr:tether containing UBX domain for GLUT4 [Planoprotostelium fungivorum]